MLFIDELLKPAIKSTKGSEHQPGSRLQWIQFKVNQYQIASNNFPGNGLITPFISIFSKVDDVLKIGS